MDLISEVIGSNHAGQAFARRVSAAGPWGMRLPAIQRMAFHLVLDGSGWLIPAKGSPAALQAGDVVLVPSGAEHGLSHSAASGLSDLPEIDPPGPRPTGTADFDVVMGCYPLSHGPVHRFLRDLPRVIVLSPDYHRYPQLRSLIDIFVADLAEDRPGSTTTRAALVDLLLAHTLRLVQEQTPAGDWPEIADPGIAAALRQMTLHPQRPWTVRQLSEIAGLSRTVFNQRFTALIGEPPISYLIGRRLTNSARLLRETRAPLATIARQVGYTSEYAFSGAFHRRYGVAPGRFRGQHSTP